MLLYWYNKVKQFMLITGGKISQVHPAFFLWQNGQSEVTGVLACHVDDFLWAGSEHFAVNVIPAIKSAFHVGPEFFICGHGHCYCGWCSARARDVVHQMLCLISVAWLPTLKMPLFSLYTK